MISFDANVRYRAAADGSAASPLEGSLAPEAAGHEAGSAWRADAGRAPAARPPLRPAVSRSRRPSRFEVMAAESASLSGHRRALLWPLLEVAGPDACPGRAVLRPLWAFEAMHRAYNMVRLCVALDRRAPLRRSRSLAASHEHRLAVALAEAVGSLDTDNGEAPLPCSDALRTIVRSLGELFGPAAGQIQVRTSVERLALPGFQRRALALAASELVVNALVHAFAAQESGTIAVTLCRADDRKVRLSVADDGWGVPSHRRPSLTGVAFDLAGLLEGELLYGAPAAGGTLAEITFPSVVDAACNGAR